MKQSCSDESKLLYLVSFLLPEGMLSYFDVVRIDEDTTVKQKVYTGGVLHIYVDERDNRTEGLRQLRPNGFTEPTLVSDFPIRDKKTILHIRRRRWVDEEGKNVILNVYNLVVTGTRYSEEFAAFLKERLGYVPDSGPFAGALLPD